MDKKAEKFNSGDRFMPGILARLTDNNPEQKTENYTRGISVRLLRKDILWNIETLLNSRSHPPEKDWNGDSEVMNSVLGYGLCDFCGQTHKKRNLVRLKDEILRQIRLFEPRLDPDSLVAKIVNDEDVNTVPVSLEIEVRGVISVVALKDELVFCSKLDLETGNATVAVMDT